MLGSIRVALVVALVGTVVSCKKLDTFSDGGVADHGVADHLVVDHLVADGPRPDLDPNKPLSTAWIKVLADSTTATFMPDGIDLDGEGKIYVEGWLQGRLKAGPDTIGADNQDSQAVIKLDPSGTALWGRHLGPVDMTGPGQATWPPHNLGFVLDPASGASHLAASFSGMTKAGNTQFASAGKKDIVVAKLDRDGAWLWATRAGGPEDEYAHDMALGLVGPVVVGDFAGTASFGSFQLTSSGGSEIYAAHLDKNGTWVKAIAAGSTWPTSGGLWSTETAFAVTPRDGGRVFVSGHALGGTSFGTSQVKGTGAYMARASLQGSPYAASWDWAVAITGLWWDLKANPSSDTFFAAGLAGNGRPGVIALAADSGKILWAFNPHAASKIGEAMALALAPDGGIYVGGYFQGTLELTADGKHTLTAQKDAANGFVLKLDAKGSVIWSKHMGSPQGTYPLSLAAGPDGALYVAGWFGGKQATLDGQVVTGPATNMNGFVWKLAP